jgi:hypothetical protein
MTLQFKGVMGEPDAVRAVFLGGDITAYAGQCEIATSELKRVNDEYRARGWDFNSIPYRIRIYIKPNQPKRGVL